MKKLIVCILLISLCNKQFAQIEKGTALPGFSVNGTYSSNKDDQSYNYNAINKTNNWQSGFNFKYGKFVKENLLLSFNIGYTYQEQNFKYEQAAYPLYLGTEKINKNILNAGISLLKYKFITENFGVDYGGSFSVSYSDGFDRHAGTLQVGVQDSLGYFSYYPVPYTTSQYQNSISASFNFTGGIFYFLSKNLSLTGSLGLFNLSYSTSPYTKQKNHEIQSTFNASLTPSFNAFGVGLVYFIRPKKTS